MQINYTYKTVERTDTMYYVHQDRLGSYDVLTDDIGTVKERLGYDVWGNRVLWNDWTQRMGYDSEDTTHIFRRGFTGHEHLGAHGIINMNGRMYDPNTASFFSPDPFVYSPYCTQSFNRYAYCLNNPLMYTDPSGEFWLSAILIGASMNWISSGFSKNADGKLIWKANWNAKGLGAAVVGGLAGGVAAGVSAVASGAAGGFITGAGNSLIQGESFKNSMMSGLKGAGIGGTIGGVTGYINKQGINKAFDKMREYSKEQVLGSKEPKNLFNTWFLGGNNPQEVSNPLAPGGDFFGLVPNFTYNEVGPYFHDIRFNDMGISNGAKAYLLSTKTIGADWTLAGRHLSSSIRHLDVGGLVAGTGMTFIAGYKTIFRPIFEPLNYIIRW